PEGNIDPRRTSKTPSVQWLHRLATHFERSVWINPEQPGEWDYSQTTRIVRRLFPMFHLSVDGLTQAVQALVGSRVYPGRKRHRAAQITPSRAGSRVASDWFELRRDRDPAGFCLLGLRQLHGQDAVLEAGRDLIAVEVLGVRERESSEVVAYVVLGVHRG